MTISMKENYKKLEGVVTCVDIRIQACLYAINSLETNKVKMLIPNQRIVVDVANRLKSCITSLQIVKENELGYLQEETDFEVF